MADSVILSDAQQDEIYDRILAAGCVITEPGKVRSDPRYWILTHPLEYIPAGMVYSTKQLGDFINAMGEANDYVDDVVKRSLVEVERLLLENPIEGRKDYVGVAKIESLTYVLPNFMNDPILGKYVNIHCNHREMPIVFHFNFYIVDTGDGIVPFYGLRDLYDQPSKFFRELTKEIEQINPSEFYLHHPHGSTEYFVRPKSDAW